MRPIVFARRFVVLARFALIALAPLTACTSSSPSDDPAQASDPGPRSGLASDTRVNALSGADREALCNWWADTLGGVGRQQSCSECHGDACTDWDVAVSSLADCLGWLDTLDPACTATVEDAEDCAFAQNPDLCASPAACMLLSDC
jgi:hypothetical protein